MHSICKLSKSYSLEGEDRIALSLLRDIVKSHDSLFYVDIGCNDPDLGNNTKLFYDLGKHGLCVDPLPSFKIYTKKEGQEIFSFRGELDPSVMSTFIYLRTTLPPVLILKQYRDIKRS